MKNKKEMIITTAVFALIWIAYYIMEFFSKRIQGKFNILMNLLPGVCLIIFAALFCLFSRRYGPGIKEKTVYILTFVAILADQGIKLLVKLTMKSKIIMLIKNYLYISPKVNTQGSWVNVRYNLGISFNFLTVINLIAVFIIVEIYRYYYKKLNRSFFIDLVFIFMISGSVCSLIDKIFWGGSLDYIMLGTLFIMDLKDLYLTFCIGLLISKSILDEKNQADNVSMTVEIKRFAEFVKEDIKR